MVGLVWVGFSPNPAYGCTCSDETLADYADEIEVAFFGREVSRTEHSYTADNGVALLFEVDRVYKGRVESRIEIRTHAQSSACGLSVSGLGPVGIVANQWQGHLSVGTCSSPVSQAELEAVFGAGYEPIAAESELIIGRVGLWIVTALVVGVLLAVAVVAARRFTH